MVFLRASDAFPPRASLFLFSPLTLSPHLYYAAYMTDTAPTVTERIPLSDNVEVWWWSDGTMTIRDSLKNRWHITLDENEQTALMELLGEDGWKTINNKVFDEETEEG